MHRVKIRELALIAVAGGLLVFEVMGFWGAMPAASAATAAVARSASHAATRAAVGMAKGTAMWLGTSRSARRESVPMLAASRDRRRAARPRVRLVLTASHSGCPVAAAIASLALTRETRIGYTHVVKQGAL